MSLRSVRVSRIALGSRRNGRAFLRHAVDSLSRRRLDIAVGSTMALLWGAGSFALSGLTMQTITLNDEQWNDVFYEADLYRTFADATMRWANHSRSSVHPLYTLTTYPLTFTLQKLAGVTPVNAVRVVLAVVAALWMAALYALLRVRGGRRVDAAVFSLLGATSGAAMFWFAVPETYALASLSIVLSLLAASLPARPFLAELGMTLASALTLSFTITNWFVGLAATKVRYAFWPAVQISINAFFVVVVLWGVEKMIFPSARFFLELRSETEYVGTSFSGTNIDVARSFVYHSLIVPAPQARTKFSVQLKHPRLTSQFSSVADGVALGIPVAIIWTLLLGWGTVQLLAADVRFGIMLLTCVAFQLCLHMVYGEETFLYSLHFLPLLLVIAAAGARGRFRLPVVALAGAAAVILAIDNFHQLAVALRMLAS